MAAALSSGLWLAALDVASRSSRRELAEAVRTYWSVHPAALLETLAAGIPGRLPLSPAWRTTLFENREPFLASLYLGLPAAGLVAAAFAVPGGRRRRALATVGLGALALALGRHAPFYDLVTTLLPPLRVLRYPVQATVFLAFAWAGLVAFGADGVATTRARPPVVARGGSLRSPCSCPWPPPAPSPSRRGNRLGEGCWSQARRCRRRRSRWRGG